MIVIMHTPAQLLHTKTINKYKVCKQRSVGKTTNSDVLWGVECTSTRHSVRVCVFPSASVFERKQNLAFTSDNRSPCCLISVHHGVASLTVINSDLSGGVVWWIHYYIHHMCILTLFLCSSIYIFIKFFVTWEHTQDEMGSCQEFGPGTFPAGFGESQGFFHNLWRTAGSCDYAYYSCWITSLCFSGQEIPHQTKVQWITL